MRVPSRTPANVLAPTAAWIAALLFWGSLFGFAAAIDGYSQAMHPVALLGARGTPHAPAFNALGLLLPGLLLAVAAWRLRAAMADSAPWAARIGARLALIAALAFALQGLLPLEPTDLNSTASRLHATAWTLWWVAFVPGALLLAFGMRDRRDWRVPALACVAIALLLAWLALAPPPQLPTGVTQRVMLAGWFGWWVGVAHRMRAAYRQAG